MGATTSLLRRNRDFRRLYLALVISLVGDWFAFVAVSALLVELTGRQSMPAAVYAASVLPVVLATPLAGVLADRVDRKMMMVVADAARVPTALLLCLAGAWGSAPLAMAAVLALALLSAFFDPVATAAVPSLVEPDDLPVANAAIGAAWGAMLIVGAGLGGLAASAFGYQAAFVINAASFAVSGLLVAGIRRATQGRREAGGAARAAPWRQAWQHVRSRPAQIALLLCKPGVGIANGIVGVLPALALVQYGAGATGLGLLLAARGLGAMLGPVLATRLRARDRRGGWLMTLCGASILLYALAYALLPLAPTLVLAALLVILAHVGGGGQWALSTMGLQAATPDELRGRVMALDYGLATAAIGISALVAALLTEAASPKVAIWGQVGVAALYGTAWLLATRRWRARGADEPLPELTT